MRIAVDAMGGDHAPQEIVVGAVEASRVLPVEILLVGNPEKIGRELKKLGSKIPIVAASEVIEMNESPAQAVKAKKDASINVAVSLVKDGKADGVVSAGNTGALIAAALFRLGRIPGVERPAIATEFPVPSGKVLLLDMGANVDCKPKQLEQFALMGSIYAEHVIHVIKPRVGLLNIGEEREKGNELTRETWPLLAKAPINFVGNVEAKEILTGNVDVVVCDGFVGNLVLKFGESIGSYIVQLMKDEISSNLISKMGLALLYPALKKIQQKISYDTYGGAPLLGIAGVVFKAHGRAKAHAITNAIREASEAVKEDMVGFISKMEKMHAG
jgi:glycerol-3-phosphate acyltransferase PlsX